jgi:hypothetical membrane protein
MPDRFIDHLDFMKYTNKILAGMLIFIGTTIFLFGIIISEALYPGYHVTQVISDLGVGPTAWLFNSTIFIFGISLIISAYLLLNIGTNRYFTVLLGLSGLGAALVGLVQETQGVPHEIAAVMVFLFGGFCAITGYNVFRGPFSLLSPLFGIITLIAMIMFALQLYIGLGTGGMERMIAYPLIIWALGAGAYLMSPGK